MAVRDTLDANLDWATFELRHTSHPVSVDLNLQNGAVAFNFNNILLPDSNVNEPASHGIFVYTIKTKNALVDGTPINNTASIYFDFNLPVVTNTTMNVIGEPLFVAGLQHGQLKLFPNPADNTTTVMHTGASASRCVLSDVFGRTVLSNAVNANGQTTLALESLAPGTYAVTLFNDGNRPVGHSRLVIVR